MVYLGEVSVHVECGVDIEDLCIDTNYVDPRKGVQTAGA